MFGIVKKLLGKKTASSAAKPAPDAGKGARKGLTAPAEPASAAAGSPGAASSGGGTGFVAKSKGQGFGGSKANPASAGEKVNVSLLGIVSLLPQELLPGRAVGDFASVHLSFPLRPILEQLGHGCVRVPLGQVRKLAPEGFFTVGADHDQKLVELPLQEILQQVDLRTFARRKDQKTVSVPEDVTSVFSIRANPAGAGGRAASAKTGGPGGTGGTTQFVRKTAAPAAGPAPAGSTQAPAASGTGFIGRKSGAPPATSSPAAPANRAEVAGSAPRPQAPLVAPASPAAPVVQPPVMPESAAPEVEAPPPVVDPPAPVAKPIAAPHIPQFNSSAAAWRSAASGRSGAPAPAPAGSATPASTTPGAGASGAAAGGIQIPLATLSQSWPEGVRAEIAAWHLGNATLVLPTSDVAAALKQGRVQYPWSRVLALLEDALGAGRVSAHGDALLELPLAVVAPSFLAQCRPGGAGSAKVPVDQTIPDLFHATPAPAATPSPGPVSVGGKGAAPGARTSGTPAVPVAARGAATFTAPPAPQVPSEVQVGTASTGGGSTLSVPLPMVNELWADALKGDIARTQIPGLKVEIPFEELDKSLKAGKIEYTWGRIRSWITPRLAEDVGAEHNDRPLTLPLKVIAPLFLQQARPGRAQRKADIAGDIPDLFSGGAAQAQGAVIDDAPPPAPAAPAGADAASPTSPANPTNSTTQFWRKPPEDLGELFGQPGKRNWTPTEIVQNTLRIKGVSGAVIAMQDGLLVAAQLPSPWKPEATAAFIPQIYARLTQYLKELNAGDLSSVTLSTASGTLLVFNAGIIYFGVLTKNDERLPLSLVRLIVTELSRHAR
jgi:predicted regulator of Ras-like GTPase activity (Roadblock/LC7/MglB family)